MRVHLEQEDTIEKQNYDNLKADQIDINDKAWKIAEQIVRRHYTDDDVAKAQIVVAKRSKDSAESKAIKILSEVGLKDKIGEWPDNLSGGQKQRLAIARSLAMDPVLMLFDEPTSALDPELVSEVLNVLRRLADDGMTMIIVTHELGFASQVADRVAFMENGKIIEEGPPNEILKTPKTQRLRLFLDKLNITAFANHQIA